MLSFVTRLMRSLRNLKQKQNFQALFSVRLKTFFAGGDLDELIQVQPEHATDFFNMVEKLKVIYVQLKRLVFQLLQH